MTLTQIKPLGLSKPVDLADNEKIRLGTGNDLEIYHSNNNNIIDCTNSNPLFIQSDLLYLMREDGNETYIKCTKDSSVELYHNNSKKLETFSTGVQVTGTLWADGLDVDDNEKLLIGTGDDLEIFHDGTHSRIIENGSGSLSIQAQNFYVQNPAANETMIVAVPDGAVELYYDNT